MAIIRFVRLLLLLLLLLFPVPVVVLAAGPVKVNIAWEYVDFPAPMMIYEVKGRPRLWDMQSVKSLAAAPVGARIDASSFLISAGEVKRFVLVLHNDSDEPKHFFAAPHVAHPVEHSLGFKFKCLCINHAYTVGPHETWYRVVEFRLSEGFVGDELTLTHGVIGIDEARAKSFAKQASPPEL